MQTGNTPFKITILAVSLIFFFGCGTSRKTTSVNPEAESEKKVMKEPAVYKAEATKFFDLIHTRLEVSLDWANREMPATAEVTLKPHFYATNKLVLNARGMAIKEVKLVKGDKREEVAYVYRNDSIIITLDKVYERTDSVTVYVDYVARPETLPKGGSAAITEDKGLYFINADGSDPQKPKQLWTQGETQAASAWFPTIDWPNQRSTQEMYITVDTAYVTLSNGKLISSIVNAQNGTRTDYWRQDLPHAPYLFMMVVGDFAVVKDEWRGKEVSYYVEPEYEPYARDIFGHTPEMMEHFSKLLGVDYPWVKYSQIAVRDYVSGAMENTTATVHGEFLQNDRRGLLDGSYEEYISHELFHQWFGDLVTCESWSNLTLNESFATYGEYLWNEYKYGRDEADYGGQSDLNVYLREARNKQVNLVRFDFKKQEDMFDAHSYNKGGRILHMLRKYVGDEAFFASLKKYLSENKFATAEVPDLRIAMEKVTGEDLNWFFNQWYYDKGHPQLRIDYRYDELAGVVYVKVTQQQDLSKTPLYKLPVAIDIYTGNDVRREKVTITRMEEEFTFSVISKPLFVNFDGEKMLLCVKNDQHTNEEWISMYNKGPLYLDRFEAVSKLANTYVSNTAEAEIVERALADRHWNIRLLALKNVKNLVKGNPDGMKPKIILMAQKDSKSDVRSLALERLAEFYPNDETVDAVIRTALNDSSYNVMNTAMGLVLDAHKAEGFALLRKVETDENKRVRSMAADFYSIYGSDDNYSYMSDVYRQTQGFEKYEAAQNFGRFLLRCNPDLATEGIKLLSETGYHHPQWFVRLSAVRSLAEISKSYGKKSLRDDQGGTTQPGDSILEERVAMANEKVRKSAEEEVNAIKAQETDPNLKKIYNKD